MSFQQIPTVFKDNAQAFATSDRVAHTDMLLDVACKAAVKSFREGEPEWALHRLTSAEERAARILGPTDWSATSQRGAR